MFCNRLLPRQPFPFALAPVPFALLHCLQKRKTPSRHAQKHAQKNTLRKNASPFRIFPLETSTEQPKRNGYSAIIPFCLHDYAVSTENALSGKSRSRTECHAPKKKAYASAILGTLNPNLFKIIDIARALCYYKQADNCILHFCASHVRRLEKYPRGRRGSPAKGVVRVNRSQGSNPCFSATRELYAP